MAVSAARKTPPIDYPELHSGDQMTREEFHRIYEQMPEDFKAELIGGIVYAASPLKNPHATNHPYLTTIVTLYAGNECALSRRFGSTGAATRSRRLRVLSFAAILARSHAS